MTTTETAPARGGRAGCARDDAELTPDELVERYTPLVWWAVRRYWHRVPSLRAVGWDDAVAHGTVGLVSASRTWLPDGGSCFKTWAFIQIRRALQVAWGVRSVRAASADWNPANEDLDVHEPECHRTAHLAEEADARLSLHGAMRLLREESPREYRVLLLWSHGWPMRRIAGRLGITHQRAHQLYAKALRRVRRLMREV